MVIAYLICLEDGSKVDAGTFDSNDRPAQRKFAKAARDAWAKGYAVITRKQH